MRSLFRSVIASFSLLLLSFPAVSVAGAVAEAATEQVTLQLKWRHQFQFAGYYAAVHKGFYRDEGLSVTLLEGGPGIAPHERVLAGPADFGVGGGDLVYQWLHDRPVVVLASILQHSPAAILTLGSSGLTTPHDLAGKRIMMLTGGRPDPEIAAMLVNEGIALGDLQMIENSDSLEELLSGGIDAGFAYVTNEPYQLARDGIAFNIIRPVSYGVDFYGDSLFTSTRQLHDHPDRVAAFLRASLKGWDWALAHSEEMIDIIMENYPVLQSREQLQFEAAQMRKLMLPEIVEIGHINPGRWRAMANTFVRLGMAPAGKALDGFLYDPRNTNNATRLWWVLGFFMAITLLAILISSLLALFYRRLRREVDVRTQKLSAEIDRRIQAETLLEDHNRELENEVEKRTRTLVEEVNERRKAIRELSETTEKLQQASRGAVDASRAKSEFLANMSHEIRTPLNTIIGINHLLRQSSLDEQQRKWLDIQDNASRMLLGVISNILDFSKIESGKLELELINFDLRKVLQHVGKLFTAEAGMKGLDLNFKIDDSLPGCFTGDPLRLGQVLTNLIGNAVKFTEKGSVTVLVSVAKKSSDTVTLDFSIRDTGIGISVEHQKTLFEPFSQSDASFNRRFGGTGLGLAITRRLLEEMKTDLHCSSTVDVGSTFTFSITLGLCMNPEVTSLLPAHETSDRIQKNPAFATLHVLLVEDDEINQLIAETLLEVVGVGQITNASSAEQVIEILDSVKPDLLLMDIQMPGMDGYQAAARIRELHGDAIPLIAMTANAVAGERQRCLAAGMNDYISKPIDIDRLVDVLLTWCAKKGNTSATKYEIATTMDRLAETLGEEGMSPLLKKLVANLSQQKTEMAALLSAGDWREAGALAHRMKGSMNMYGGEYIVSLLRKIEKYDETRQTDLREIAGELQVELEKAIQLINGRLADASDR